MGTSFRGTEKLRDLLTLKNVHTVVINKTNLKTYNEALIMSNDHLSRYQPGDNIIIK